MFLVYINDKPKTRLSIFILCNDSINRTIPTLNFNKTIFLHKVTKMGLDAAQHGGPWALTPNRSMYKAESSGEEEETVLTLPSECLGEGLPDGHGHDLLTAVEFQSDGRRSFEVPHEPPLSWPLLIHCHFFKSGDLIVSIKNPSFLTL